MDRHHQGRLVCSRGAVQRAQLDNITQVALQLQESDSHKIASLHIAREANPAVKRRGAMAESQAGAGGEVVLPSGPPLP